MPEHATPASPALPGETMPIDEGAATASYDVAIIGGGVNGTGVARDLSLRGLRVVLFERHDLAFGASGNSSGMIHGGARYLPSNPKVTRQSCQDSGYIQQIAPHLLFRIPFLMPVEKGLRGRIMLELYDAFFHAYDRYQPLKRGEPHTRLGEQDLLHLEPGLTGRVAGGVTFDEWGVDGTRLCVLNALDARERGAVVHVHTTVESIAKAPPSPGGPVRYVVRARDRITQRTWVVRAANVVNASGAWGPITASLGKLARERVRVRPAKGIHVVFDRRISNYAILTEAIDGRQIFLEPWENMSVLGTTDDDFFGDLDDVVASSEEVRYLVQGIARIFPAIREARAIGTTAAVRPTLYEYGPNEDALSREHAIVDHAKDGAPGVYSMIGGKLASYRLFAQEMSDRIAQNLAPTTRCVTHIKPLPGGDRVPDALALSEQHELTPVAARRLVYRHGSRVKRILQRMARRPRERAIVCACEPVFEAEIRHVLEEEMARSVDDVARRTRLGLGACGGMRCAARCGQIVADELGLSPHEGIEQARRFLETRAKARIVAMGPGQARQEALALAHHRAMLGVGRKGRS
ncbi:FAD-dependent oxidoreductase [Pendulispora albinea]|uniref:Glycerol-3-phosphate dehydrogenase n=1 Tax=Pendulispora albinea TaxID=2741071 RepID=A0ABZ2M8B7_9BACT